MAKYKKSLEQKIKTYRFGLFAELVVIVYLFFTFHKILAWRYKTKVGEIDIVAKRAGALIFLEVKARKDKTQKEVLSSNQIKRIGDAARYFVTKNSQYEGLNYRFDLIIFNYPLRIEHIKAIN